ncbi:phosphate acyltransferase PlsX [Spiroplasma endosymbiont of Amphibalanus improvisus]|uniref:phosphate acyltransferase PlsX n=1 Tax=Spiroplasma endosymbiont of Amphibalanus improvisus TaxID=3066327 RepID=UPI00313B09A3
MKKIIIDVMGSDLGPQPAIESCAKFSSYNNDVHFILVGDKEQIKKHIKNLKKYKFNNYEIISTTEVIEMSEGITAFRRKKDSSMTRALEMLKDEKGDAVISAGSTAAFLSGAHFLIGELEGVTRPGFMPFLPTLIKNKVMNLIDVGANLENKPEDLLKFALMATVYHQEILNNEKPLVGLLNIGTEETKGLELHKETYKLLKSNEKINFHGNIEPRDITSGFIDIVVCDGYTGNMVLKSLEGIAYNLIKGLKTELTKSFFTKLKVLPIKNNLKAFGEIFDYKNNAAAILMGAKKPVIKTHGSSDLKSFMATLKLTYNVLDKNVIDKIKENIS